MLTISSRARMDSFLPMDKQGQESLFLSSEKTQLSPVLEKEFLEEQLSTSSPSKRRRRKSTLCLNWGWAFTRSIMIKFTICFKWVLNGIKLWSKMSLKLKNSNLERKKEGLCYKICKWRILKTLSKLFKC